MPFKHQEMTGWASLSRWYSTHYNRDMNQSHTPRSPHDVVWETPSEDEMGSMPLGNGAMGLNVWVELDGVIRFYVSRTDSWDEHGRLLKLGRVSLTCRPAIDLANEPFEQRLDTQTGCIHIRVGDRKIKVWVDAHRPVARVEIQADKLFEVEVRLEPWRVEDREPTDAQETHSALHQELPYEKVCFTADTIVPGEQGSDGALVWYHRNESSCWADTLVHQGLGELVAEQKDPLLHRTCGGGLWGQGLQRFDDLTLQTSGPVDKLCLNVTSATAQTQDVKDWLQSLRESMGDIGDEPSEQDRLAHTTWWQNFWQRSNVDIQGDAEACRVGRGYRLQRFINACAGRGDFPIKFNGSIFTTRYHPQDNPNECYDPDYRRWGGGYWFQNTRLIYWTMLMAGDFDLMDPFFAMYAKTLPLAEARSRIYFGFDSPMLPETMTFWGTYLNANYGYDRSDKHVSDCENQYIKRHWDGTLELASMMLQRYDFTRDPTFLRNMLLKTVPSLVGFFFDYYKERDKHGHVVFSPSQSLETWQEAVNPTPVVAGLQWVLDQLLKLAGDAVSQEQEDQWRSWQSQLPPVPTRTVHGNRFVIPALQYDQCRNSENPELYAVFPYPLYVTGTDNADIGRETFDQRQVQGTMGWRQDAIQAAMLGMTEQAKRDVVVNFSDQHYGKPANPSRFPGFFGPNFDWLPDQDQGSVACIALQRMLVQYVEDQVLLLPAWPREWDVQFKLHIPQNTVIQCDYRQGQIQSLHITPEHRRQAIVMPDWMAPSINSVS